jgi:hypothetical protein
MLNYLSIQIDTLLLLLTLSIGGKDKINILNTKKKKTIIYFLSFFSDKSTIKTSVTGRIAICPSAVPTDHHPASHGTVLVCDRTLSTDNHSELCARLLTSPAHSPDYPRIVDSLFLLSGRRLYALGLL